MGFFDKLQDTVNGFVGQNYRDIYFQKNPDRYHECKGCGELLDREKSEVTIDHIVPQKCGGTNAVTNLQVLCRSCNSKKKDAINFLSVHYSGAALLREIKKKVGC